MDLAVDTINKDSLEKEALTKTCRLCLLKINGSYQSIIGSVKYMLELVVRLKLLISEYPIICHNCLILLKQSYTFKASCLDIEEKIQTFSKVTKKELVDLKQVLIMDNINIETDTEDVVCRICLKLGKGNLYTKLDRYNEDPVKHMMDKCLPEVKTETIPQVLCPPCLELLEEYFHFLMQCLDTEEKINYYCEVKDVYNKIDLYSVYIFSITMEDNGLVYLNGDGDHPESSLPNVMIKCEQPEEVCSDDSAESEPQSAQIVTLQVTKDKDGDEIITDFHTVISSDEEHEQDSHQICITPMNEVLNVKYSEDPKVDEAKASMEMEETRKREMEPLLQSDESTEGDDSDRDPDYLSKHKKKNRCKVCSFSCETKTGLKIHHTIMHQRNRSNSERKMYKCWKSGCQFESMNNSELKTHISEHKSVGTMTCSICNGTFTKKKLYNMHVAAHRRALSPKKETSPKTKHKTFGMNGQTFRMFRCQFCPYQTRRRANLTRHIIVHKKTSELKTYKCENCSFETIQKENLLSHLQSHNSEMMTKKCFLCSFQPTTEEALKAHVELIHKNKSSSCI